jgi:hypothetical protein
VAAANGGGPAGRRAAPRNAPTLKAPPPTHTHLQVDRVGAHAALVGAPSRLQVVSNHYDDCHAARQLELRGWMVRGSRRRGCGERAPALGAGARLRRDRPERSALPRCSLPAAAPLLLACAASRAAPPLHVRRPHHGRAKVDPGRAAQLQLRLSRHVGHCGRLRLHHPGGSALAGGGALSLPPCLGPAPRPSQAPPLLRGMRAACGMRCAAHAGPAPAPGAAAP